VPVLTERLAHEQTEEARRIFNGVMTAALLLLVGGVLLLEALAPLVVNLVAGSRGASDRATALTLTRIILVQPLFLGLGGFSIGVMNAYRRFRPISIAPIAYNAAMIFAALVLVQIPLGGSRLGVVGLAIGVVLAGLMHLVVQVPSLRSLGWKVLSFSDLRHPGVRRVAALMFPISLGLTASQINIAVDRYLGVGLPAGGISALYFAGNLVGVPIGVFTSALAVVMFPYFARHAALGEIDALRHRATLAVRLNLFVMIPAAVGLIVLGPQIVALLFQHGSFSATSTDLVYPPLAFFALGVAAQASIFIVVRVYYSFQEVVTPMKIAFISVALNLVANLILVHPLGAGGLALGTSMAAIVNFTLLVVYLRPRLGGFEGARLFTTLARIGAGCVTLTITALGVWLLVAGGGPTRLDLRHYTALALAIGLAGAVYLGTELALRSQEARVALDVVLRRRAASEGDA
jgi:putative peptidoglycan lipid II flippase